MRGTVLIVDDDPCVRQALGEFLGAEGYKVLSAPHGRAALAVLEDEIPNLILIDVAMPVMSGWKLVEALSHYPDLARIPRILMSDRDDIDAVLRRAFRVLEKPLNLGWLASAVAATVRSRRPAVASAAA
jgi:CheY-like chemotaxis protein